jgi:uncharacterized LabA/DUF88 family protein
MSQVNPPMPGKPLEHRVAVYVDGFNLYFGVRGSGLGKYLWLDLCAFSKSLLKERQRLVAVKYFTARIARPESKRKRQNAYLDALSTLDNGLFSVAYGNYQQNPTTCSHCGQSSDVPSEKQTDVNIAVAMLTDAFKDGFDVALLVSADSDLCPVVTSIRSLYPSKQVIAMFPPSRASRELANAASATFNIGKAKLAENQFPDVIQLPSGYALKKPELWDEPEYQAPH